jgi:hypothetical protein
MAEKKNSKRKVNLLKLFSEMNQLAKDAVDKEIVKRFKTVIDTMEDDITKTTLVSIMKQNDSLDLSMFGEGVQPYIRHYIFMMKRGTAKGK